jgi:hypothetical protein
MSCEWSLAQHCPCWIHRIRWSHFRPRRIRGRRSRRTRISALHWPNLQSPVDNQRRRCRQRHARQLRHDQRRSRIRRRGTHQQAHTGAIHAACPLLRILRDDCARLGATVRHLRGLFELQAHAAHFDRRHPLLLADNLGNRHPLRTQALSHAHAPFPPDDCAGQRRLCQHPPRRHIHAVVLVVDAQVQTHIGRPMHRLGHGEPLQIRDSHFCAVDGETHGHDSRNQPCHGKCQAGHHQAEEIDHDVSP